MCCVERCLMDRPLVKALQAYTGGGGVTLLVLLPLSPSAHSITLHVNPIYPLTNYISNGSLAIFGHY